MNDWLRVLLYGALLAAALILLWRICCRWPWDPGGSRHVDPLERLLEQHSTLQALTTDDIAWAAGHGLDVPAELQRMRGRIAHLYRLRSQTPPPPFARPGIDVPRPIPPSVPHKHRDGSTCNGCRPAEPPRMRIDAPWMGVHAKLISNPEWEAWAREHAPHRLPSAMELHGDGPVRRELMRRGYIEKPDGSYHPGPVELEPSPAGGWQPKRPAPPNPGVATGGIPWPKRHRHPVLGPPPRVPADPDWGTK